ncbi:uncharacterized protein BO80DRAFT_467223 [Aspergillus ibericus CBS 121593]|uniref:Uncharacterized protein n=1 Tax=Aspergillus ibericus CBS 121593 TaxID=1448316 RepID=A0A395GRQ2_9EURO|nr:hypothetical protein BO80DRAFT_467223 [Aspergillus ibericus CBS 121593]RAK98086.1 hypothetical protein BO80DRAFT_467223 [Aspergillus ibericus CBS 121593]
MATPTLPFWLLPSIYSSSRFGESLPPTWHVVFTCPMEDPERVAMMTELSSTDEEWPERPQAQMRRLVEIPWLTDWAPPTSIVFTLIKDDPLIIIDDQSPVDHTAIIVWKSPGASSPEAARVPIDRANVLLGIAAKGELSSNYPRILPEPKQGPLIKTTKAILPPHLSGLRLDPTTPTLISLVHLPPNTQENLESTIGHRIIIHNWPPHQEPCSRAQLYRMFQALKICHPGNDQAFALFIDEDADSYHIVRATGSSVPNISDPGAKKVELSTLPFEQVQNFWTAAWNPESRTPSRMPQGPYRYNPAMWELHTFGGEPIVDPDDIPGSLDTSIIFILEPMTPTELRKIRSEMFTQSDEPYMWVDVSDRLISPDMQGLLAYFESEEFTHHAPPSQFLAIDRKTLSDAMDPIDEREDWEAIIVASYEGGDIWFEDEEHRAFGHISTGYGYDRKDFEEAEMAYINLKIENMSYDELCPDGRMVYWSAYRAWAENHMGGTFARSFGPEGMKVSSDV